MTVARQRTRLMGLATIEAPILEHMATVTRQFPRLAAKTTAVEFVEEETFVTANAAPSGPEPDFPGKLPADSQSSAFSVQSS